MAYREAVEFVELIREFSADLLVVVDLYIVILIELSLESCLSEEYPTPLVLLTIWVAQPSYRLENKSHTKLALQSIQIARL